MSITLGSRVCRKGTDRPVVGTVVHLYSTTARVQWDRSLTGLVRLATGKSQSSLVRLGDIVLETEFTPRVIPGPQEQDWQPQHINVFVHDGRLVHDNKNLFVFQPGDADKALALARQVNEATGYPVSVQQRQQADMVPAGCRRPRTYSRWVTLLTLEGGKK